MVRREEVTGLGEREDQEENEEAGPADRSCMPRWDCGVELPGLRQRPGNSRASEIPEVQTCL